MGDNGVSAEGIVSFGGGVTAIAVHEGGIPRFVRVLGTGGRELTDAISAELEHPARDRRSAEASTRGDSHDELVDTCRAPRSSVRSRCCSTKCAARSTTTATSRARRAWSGSSSPVVRRSSPVSRSGSRPWWVCRPAGGTPSAVWPSARSASRPRSYPRLDPYLPAVVGLALGGAGIGTVVDLAPRQRRKVKSASANSGSALKVGVAVAAGLIVLLGVPTYLAKQGVSDKNSEKNEAIAHNQELMADIAEKAPIQAAQTELDSIESQLASLLETDVSWSQMLQDVSKTMPDGVWLTSFQGQINLAPPPEPVAPPAEGEDADADAAAAAPVTPAAPALSGTVTVAGKAYSYPDVASWIKMVGDETQFPAFTAVWVSSAAETEAAEGGEKTVEFSSSASLTEAAHSNRLQALQGGDE